MNGVGMVGRPIGGVGAAVANGAPIETRSVLGILESCEKQADEMLEITARLAGKVVGDSTVETKTPDEPAILRNACESLDRRLGIALLRLRQIENSIG